MSSSTASLLYLSPVFIRRHLRWNKNKDSGKKDREIQRMLKIGLRERENKIMSTLIDERALFLEDKLLHAVAYNFNCTFFAEIFQVKA